MKDAKDLIPWEITALGIRPFEGYWSFNPSIHFDGQTWRCVLRCCDYAMPDGVTIRSKNARPTGQQTKNAMVILDPQTWKPIQTYKMHERDNLPRASTPHVGYEDMRLFKTDAGGLQGIAASLHLRRGGRVGGALQNQNLPGAQSQPPEQVLLSFDEAYNIVAAQPIRGDGWSGTPQKNWVPFDHCVEPRFLYSIGKGTMFDVEGSVHGDRAIVRPSIHSVPVGLPMHPVLAKSTPPPAPVSVVVEPAPPPAPVLAPERREEVVRTRRPDLRTMIRGGDMRIVRGKRMVPTAPPTSRAQPRPIAPQAPQASQVSQASQASIRVPAAMHRGGESTRMMGTGRALLPRYEGLRGGTQLVRVDEDAWLGIGHEMKFVSGKKYYWHVFYLVNAQGAMRAVSEPMKLAPNGIEFAAGLAIDGDRAVVSFGVDDMDCCLGETRLSAVMEVLQKTDR